MDTLESFYNYGRKWRVARTMASICCRVAEYFCSGCDNERLATALRASTLASTSNRTVRRSDATSTSSRRRWGCGGKWWPIEGRGRKAAKSSSATITSGGGKGKAAAAVSSKPMQTTAVDKSSRGRNVVTDVIDVAGGRQS
ncbi:hypothetical protein T12_13373 [Trichinella patagoniensis]|uniref:Uncharacterized protein n=1 Tax=Trichinella patagoniensis TaxID=990121 RepID=A0A0V0ZTR5_9BILA|nr:hypothetical protein T12_13373 [Trichinella patagoniensis]